MLPDAKCVVCGAAISDPFGIGYCFCHPRPMRTFNGRVGWNWCVVKRDGFAVTGQHYGKDMRCCLDAIDKAARHGCLVATIARHDGEIGYVGVPKVMTDAATRPGAKTVRQTFGALRWASTVDNLSEVKEADDKQEA